jgi:hypothetical protein
MNAPTPHATANAPTTMGTARFLKVHGGTVSQKARTPSPSPAIASARGVA